MWASIWANTIHVWWTMEGHANDYKCCNHGRHAARGKNLLLLVLEPNIFECQTSCLERLVPIFTDHVLDTTCQSKNKLTTIYTMLDVVKAKPNLILQIVGGTTFFLQSIIHHQFRLDITQSLDICLHGPTYVDIIGWKFCNVPIRRRVIILKNWQFNNINGHKYK